MKNNLLKHVVYMTKLFMYVFFIQCFSMSIILAKDGNAQIKSIEDVHVSIRLENMDIKSAFKKIEKATDYNFVFAERELKGIPNITLETNGGSFYELLSEIARQTNLSFKQVDDNIHVKRKEIVQVPIPSETTVYEKVSGTVKNEQGESIPGASILIKGTTKGTVTDLDGNFNIDVPSEGGIIVVSFVGYKSKEVPVSGNRSIAVILEEDLNGLDEVVVIGYGSTKKENLVGAVSQIGSKEIADLPVNTFEQTLAGQVSGVQLRQTGSPGGGPELLIRGMGSLGNNAPLYVVDGIPLGNIISQNDNFQLNSIATEDIESISVLKDATAKAIYGSRASNGVVIITTKRGKKGKTNMNFSAYTGMSRVMDFDKPNNLNAAELAQFQMERLEDRYLFNGAWGGLEQAHYTRLQNFLTASENDPKMAKGTDWFDEITRTGVTSNYHFSANGGSENFLYNISASYRDEEGVVIGTKFSRITLRANIESKLTERFKVGMNFAPTFAKNTSADTEPNSGGFSAFSAINSANWVDPTAQVYNSEGELNPSTHGILSRQNFNGQPIPNGSGLFWTASPVARILWRTQESKTNTFNGSAFLEGKIYEGLTAKSTLSVNYIDRQTFNYTPKTIPLDGLTPDINGRPNSSSAIGQVRNTNLIWDNQLNYTKTFGDKHHLDALALISIERRKSEGTNISSTDFVDEDFIYPNFGNTDPGNVNNFTGGYGINELTRVGILGRASYNYDSKYYVTAAFRRDATSRFGSANRWGNFPAFSAAWRVSEEDFFANMKNIVSDLRLEGGWGKSGNDAGIGNYSWQGNINPFNYIFGGAQTSGYSIVALPNNELTWEGTEQLDFGMDVGLFTNRLNLTFDWYRTTSIGFLGNTPLPTTTGFGSIIDNVGKIENKGWEIGLNTIDLVNNGKGFTYDIGVNFSINRNKLLELQNDQEQPIGQAGNGTRFSILRVGDPIGIYRGFKVLGFYSQEDLDNPNVAKYPQAVVGSVKVADGNGDGQIDFSEADYVDIGNANAKFLFGMRHNLRYKSWDLSIIANGAIGQQIYDQKNQQLHNLDGVFNVAKEVLTNRYRPGVEQDILIPASPNLPNGAIIEARPESDLSEISIPTTKENTTRYWRSPNSYHIKDADYLWIKNITLGYNLKAEQIGILERYFNSARLYASVQNPVVFSEYKTGSPEIQKASDNIVRNVNEGSYPTATFYSLGLKVNF